VTNRPGRNGSWKRVPHATPGQQTRKKSRKYIIITIIVNVRLDVGWLILIKESPA
jgi:hypothetical protein